MINQPPDIFECELPHNIVPHPQTNPLFLQTFVGEKGTPIPVRLEPFFSRLPLELVLEILQFTDFLSVPSLLSLYPFLLAQTRVFVSKDLHVWKFTDIEHLVHIPFEQYDNTHARAITLMELSYSDIQKVMRDPSAFAHRFTPYTFVYFEFMELKPVVTRFTELLKQQGSRYHCRREEYWVDVKKMLDKTHPRQQKCYYPRYFHSNYDHFKKMAVLHRLGDIWPESQDEVEDLKNDCYVPYDFELLYGTDDEEDVEDESPNNKGVREEEGVQERRADTGEEHEDEDEFHNDEEQDEPNEQHLPLASNTGLFARFPLPPLTPMDASLLNIRCVILQNSTKIESLFLPHATRVKITFLKAPFERLSLRRCSFPRCLDLRIHFNTVMPLIKENCIGHKQNYPDFETGDRTMGAEIADVRALSYLDDTVFHSPTTVSQAQMCELYFLLNFKNVYLIGLHDQLLVDLTWNICGSRFSQFIWRSTVKFDESAVLHYDNPLEINVMPDCWNIYIEANLPNTTVPVIKVRNGEELNHKAGHIQIKDGAGGLCLNSLFTNLRPLDGVSPYLFFSTTIICNSKANPIVIPKSQMYRVFGSWDTVLIGCEFEERSLMTFPPSGFRVMIGLPDSMRLTAPRGEPFQIEINSDSCIENLSLYHISDRYGLVSPIDVEFCFSGPKKQAWKVVLGREFGRVTEAENCGGDCDQNEDLVEESPSVIFKNAEMLNFEVYYGDEGQLDDNPHDMGLYMI